MGAESYSSVPQLSDCPNCGIRKGYMGCSRWCHGEIVCGKACGERLHKKIQGGMLILPESWEVESRRYLRIQIQILKRRLSACVKLLDGVEK